MNNWKKLIEQAKTETDETLSKNILDKTTLSESMMESIAPSTLDKSKLKELADIMRDSTKSNREKAESLSEISKASDVVVNLVGKFL